MKWTFTPSATDSVLRPPLPLAPLWTRIYKYDHIDDSDKGIFDISLVAQTRKSWRLDCWTIVTRTSPYRRHGCGHGPHQAQWNHGEGNCCSKQSSIAMPHQAVKTWSASWSCTKTITHLTHFCTKYLYRHWCGEHHVAAVPSTLTLVILVSRLTRGSLRLHWTSLTPSSTKYASATTTSTRIPFMT